MGKTTIETNDAGFEYVISKKGSQAYRLHNEDFYARARAAVSGEECYKALYQWLRFFRKGHIGITKINALDSSISRAKNAKPYLKTIDKNTLLLRIPSFGYKPSVDSVVLANRGKLLAAKNLIIDLRGNGGGSNGSFYQLIPLIYTNPIRILWVKHLATPLNNEAWLRFIRDSSKFAYSKTDVDYAQRSYERLEAKHGEFVNLQGDSIFAVQGYPVLEFPKNVGIIIDGGYASATEEFLWQARQSRKVKLFGRPTFGAYDISNMHFAPSPCGDFELGYSRSKAMVRLDDNYVIDDIGFQPDFYFDKNIPDSVWVDAVSGIMRRW